MPASKKKSEQPLPAKFEDAMDELESIVEEMEASELPLEELIDQYTRGMKLVKLCGGKLNEAEKQVEVLTDDEPARAPKSPPQAHAEPDEPEDGDEEDSLF